MKVAIYARYSSDLQRERSIEDQIRNCRLFAAKSKWTVLEDHIYADRAVSGFTTVGRDALQRLLATAKLKPKPFDYILIDDTSRLSRDQVDQQEIVRELKYSYPLYITQLFTNN